jgi:hypothetical protein
MTDGVTADMVVTVYVMNPVNIGAPSDNTVTSSKLSGNITMPADLTVTGDVAFDSPTFVVDNANSRVGLGTATPSVPVDIVGEVKISSHLNMPDNAIAKFGTGSDLQIYHDGTDTWIDESGAGSLKIRGNYLQLLSPQDELFFQGQANGSSYIYHNGLEKLATTSTGIDVTGTATMDGLTVSGSSTGTLNVVNFLNTDTSANSTSNRLGLGISNSAGINYTYIEAKEIGVDAYAEMNFYTGSTTRKRLTLGTGGNISFYEDTGSTAKLFWDASAERLGIGTTSPSAALETFGGTSFIGAKFKGYSGGKTALVGGDLNTVWFGDDDGSIGTVNNFKIRGAANTATIVTNSETRVTVDGSGNLLVGKTSGPNYNSVGIDLTPLGEIQATGDSRNVATFNRQTTDGDIAVFRKDGTAVGSIGVDSSNNMYFESTASSHTGLTFPDNAIVPRKDGSNSDAGVDLGASSVRFKDLYLSGTANVGKAVVTGAVQSELQLYSSHSYSNNRNWSLITNHFGSGNWGGFSLERSTSTGGTPSEAMFGITLAGLVGIGVGGLSGGAQPSAKLHIKQAANKSEGDSHFRIEGAGYSGFHWLNGTAYYIGQNSNGRQLRMYSGSNEGVGVYLTNGGNSWSSYSDERLKENIQDIGSVTEKIKDIRCVTYNRKDVDDENKHETIGFIAQDFIGKFDQVLDESKVLDSDEETRYSIRYTETIPILMKAIQELSTTVDDLKAEIQELKDNG